MNFKINLDVAQFEMGMIDNKRNMLPRTTIYTRDKILTRLSFDLLFKAVIIASDERDWFLFIWFLQPFQMATALLYVTKCEIGANPTLERILNG